MGLYYNSGLIPLHILVGGFSPLLKIWVSWDAEIPHMEKYNPNVPKHQPSYFFGRGRWFRKQLMNSLTKTIFLWINPHVFIPNVAKYESTRVAIQGLPT